MAAREIRLWTLVRGLSEHGSHVFWALIALDEDRKGLWGATVAGLEGRLVAMGSTRQEAEQNAIEMFQEMVDHALDTHAPLQQKPRRWTIAARRFG